MGCLITTLLLVALLIGGVAYLIVSDRRRSRQRLDRLELELGRLSLEVQELRIRSAGGPAAATAETPEPSPTEEVPPTPEQAPPPRPEAASATQPPPSEGDPEEAAPEAPTPPRSAPPVEPPPAEPPRPPLRIDWEQWIGVRGAAVLGGVVLAIAGFFFLRYSIEAGWIQPPVRVGLGLLSGVGALVAGAQLRRRSYEALANALSGAGIVLLYASTWAAHSLYGLIGFGVAFAVMALVTVAGGALSWRYRSLVIALLGLVGGFATPLLLAAEQDNPFGLFAYLLLLNVGLAALARRRGWPLLGPLSLAATLFYQGLWILLDMDPGEELVGLAILAVFAAFFAFSNGFLRRTDAVSSASPRWVRVAGLITPFLFALYFAGRSDLSADPIPLVALLALLLAGAAWTSRVHRLKLLEESAAAAAVAVMGVWFLRVAPTGAVAWQAVAGLLVLGGLLHLALELSVRRRSSTEGEPAGALVALLGLLGLLVLAPLLQRGLPFWAVVGGALGLALLLFRQAVLCRLPLCHQAATCLVGLLFFHLSLTDGTAALAERLPGAPGSLGLASLAMGLCVLLQLFALRRRTRSAEVSALLLPLILLPTLLAHTAAAPASYFAVGLGLSMLALLASTRADSTLGYLVTTLLLVVVQAGWSIDVQLQGRSPAPGLAWEAGTVLLLTFWPFLAGGRLQRPGPFRVAALVAPLWFVPLGMLFEDAFGDDLLGFLPIGLAAISLGALLLTRRSIARSDSLHRHGMVWFGAVALTFVALAVPLQLEREWVTVGWALQGLAVLALWRRLDHAGLKYFALALLAAVTVRLVANPALLTYHSKATLPILNWLAYTYLVPAAALLLSARLLATAEAGRARTWEAPIYRRQWPIWGSACGFAAIAVVFVWINLTIFDAFSAGPAIDLSLDRLPARDLTLSLSWVAYALLLLGLGIARSSVGLRWISLLFLVLSISKVFLYDLGELGDLYRVASLVGLALTLLLVSLLYQRFVFRGVGDA